MEKKKQLLVQICDVTKQQFQSFNKTTAACIKEVWYIVHSVSESACVSVCLKVEKLFRLIKDTPSFTHGSGFSTFVLV